MSSCGTGCGCSSKANMTALKGGEVKLAGNFLEVGDEAPVVELVAKDLSTCEIGGKGKLQLIVAVPSLDTAVCASEARKFNEEASKIENLETVVVSMDLPFAMGRFCTTEGIENLKVLIDFRKKEFAYAYGVAISNGPLAGLNARAIYLIGKNGEIAYKQIVPEITSEPDYEEALNAVKNYKSSCGCGGNC